MPIQIRSLLSCTMAVVVECGKPWVMSIFVEPRRVKRRPWISRQRGGENRMEKEQREQPGQVYPIESGRTERRVHARRVSGIGPLAAATTVTAHVEDPRSLACIEVSPPGAMCHEPRTPVPQWPPS